MEGAADLSFYVSPWLTLRPHEKNNLGNDAKRLTPMLLQVFALGGLYHTKGILLSGLLIVKYTVIVSD